MRQGLELVAVQLAVEARPGSRSVVQGNLAGAFERAGRGNAHERALERPAGERGADDVVLCAASRSGSVGVPSRRSVPAIFPVSIVEPAQSRTSSAIWKATPSATPYRPSRRRAGRPPRRARPSSARSARCTPRPSSTGRASACAEAPRRARAASVASRGRDRLGVAGRGQLRERAREEVVARSPGRRRRRTPTRQQPCRGGSARGRSGRRGRASPCARARPRRRPRATAPAPAASRGRRAAGAAACRRRRAPRSRRPRRGPGWLATRAREPLLERVEVLLETVGRADRRRACAHAALPRRAARRCRRRRCGTGRRAKPFALEQLGERVGRGEAAHARGQVRVRRRRPAAPCRAAARPGRTRRGRTARACRAAS